MAYDLGTAHGKIELEYTGHRDVERAQNDMDDTGKSAKKAEGDLKKLKTAFLSLAKGAAVFAKFSAIGVGLIQAGAAAGNLVVQLLGAVPALTSILSLSSALPGLFAGIAASVGVLKAAFAGVGDAVKAAFTGEEGAAKFNEALKKLSPEAQTFAKAVRAVYPALHQLQQGLQDTFFASSNLAGIVPKAGAALASLSPELSSLTRLFGSTTKSIAEFATSGTAIDFVRSSIGTFRAALAQVTPAIVPILKGLIAVGTVGLPLLSKLGGAVGGLADKFANWLSAVASDGRLQSWIDTALSTLKTLGSIASNVGGILESVFGAAASTGGGLLNTLAGITGAFDDFLKSAAGKSAITGLFSSLAAVAGQLTPVITTLVGALAKALGPAIKTIAEVFGPALLGVVKALAPAFGPLASALAGLLTAVAPLLPPIAQLLSLFVQYASTGLSALAAELGPVISLLGGGLTQAFAALLPVVQAVTGVLPLAAQLGAQLATAFAPLVPVIVQLAQTFTDALLPVLPSLIASASQLIPAIVQLAQAFSGSLISVLQQIIPLIPTLVSGFAAILPIVTTLITTFLNITTSLINFGATLAGLVTTVASFVVSLASGFVGALTAAYNAVVSVGGTIIAWFAGLPGKIGAAISALPGFLTGTVSSAIKSAAFAFGAGIGTLISLAANAPGRIGSAIAGLAGSLAGAASRAWSAAKNAFSAGVSGAISIARALPGRAAGAIAALPGQLRSIASSAWNSLKSAFSSGVSTAAGIARSLPGKVRSAVGSLGGLLVSAGRDVVLGLAHGITGAVGAAVSAAVSVGKQVISGIKSTLKINSPSRVMITLGRYITQGLAKGLTGTLAQIKSASNKVANAVNDAFSDKLIKKGARNSVLSTLSKGVKQLNSLVGQSATVAGKLKTAQSKLADAQKLYVDSYYAAKQKVLDSFQLVTPGQDFVNLDLVKERFKDAVSQAKQFAADIATLAKRGLNKDLLAQLTEAGPADGSAMASALANASAGDIKAFNALQTQLNGAAVSTGKVTQDALYKAGVQAAQGIVNGLKSQQKSIDKQMDSIANSMVKAIKKALKIKSPSRAMFELGAYISQGLANGIDSLRGKVVEAAKSLATASVLPTVNLSATNAVATNTAGFSQASAPAPAATSFVQNVYALPGMSAKQTADYAFTKLNLALSTGVGAVSLPAPVPSGA
jgi:phage-related protein